MSRWSEVIEDDGGRRSSTRLGYLFGLSVIAFPIVVMTIRADYDLLPQIIGAFSIMVGGTSIWNKVSESGVQKASLNPDPIPPVPVPPAGPLTAINIGDTTKKGA